MSLKSLVREERKGDPLECPECENKGEKMNSYSNRCTTSSCGVLWWYPQ